MHLGPEVAAERLRAALAEQERLRDAYDRAAGTPTELATRMRLHASNLQVAVCTRMASGGQRARGTAAGH